MRNSVDCSLSRTEKPAQRLGLRLSQLSAFTGGLLFLVQSVANAQSPPAPPAQPVEKEPPPAGAQAPDSATQDWCTLPLCREAEGLRRAGDLQGALKLYRYIQDEVDVDEKVVRKPLLWFAIAALYGELEQMAQGLEALQKYKQYLATRLDSDLPAGQRREDVERLEKSLRTVSGKLRIGGDVAGLHVVIDGKPAGDTPLGKPFPISIGKHHIEIIGDTTQVQDVEVSSGQELVLWPLQPQIVKPLPIVHDEQVVVDRAARPRWRIALGAVGLGVGVTMIGVGAAALAADGQCVTTSTTGSCPIVVNASGQPVRNVVDGKPTGAGLLATGIVISAVSSVIIALPGKRPPLQAGVSFYNGAGLTLATSY